MIEYTVEYCLKNNIEEASLFVGEIHNSDIEWYVENKNNKTLPEYLEKQSEIVHSETMSIINGDYRKKQMRYLLSLGSGSFLAMSIYALLGCLIVINI